MYGSLFNQEVIMSRRNVYGAFIPIVAVLVFPQVASAQWWKFRCFESSPLRQKAVASRAEVTESARRGYQYYYVPISGPSYYVSGFNSYEACERHRRKRMEDEPSSYCHSCNPD